MLHLVGRSTAPSHEDVFIARYDALVLVALRVTDGDRQEAEDLVHEAFIRFTLVQPPLDQVQHLDAYLSRMLRNMHTSRIRRRQRAAETSLSILDYDTLDIGFRALDARTQLEVREALRAACDYGCARKRSSKTGSVFLLRFFHGYLPSEIARLARLSTAIVDALVFRARKEVKGYVEDPLRAFGAPGTPGTTKVVPSMGGVTRGSTALRSPAHGGHHFSGAGNAGTPESTTPEHSFTHELRARVFNEPHVRCWSTNGLRDLYRDPPGESLSRDALADLVGCPVCLDAANVLLGLPLLAERWPSDTLGPGTRGGPKGGAASGSGGATGSGGAKASIASARRRARDVFEHRPRELRVSVNGFVIGAHTIGAHESDLTLSVNLNEPMALVELLSEQGLCLAFLDLAPPPDGNARQRRRVELSDGRHAQLEVTFAGPWPTVRASYSDPRQLAIAGFGVGSAFRRTIADARDEHVSDLTGGDETTGTAPRPIRSPWWPRLPRFIGLRPASITVLLAVVLIWLLFWTPGTTVSAAERIADTIKWLVSSVFGSHASTTSPEMTPRTPDARDIPLPAPIVAAPLPKPSAIPDVRRTYLELKALAELQQVDAYLGQELSLGASDDPSVQLRAVVDTKARRDTLIAALGPLLADARLQARITTLDEIAARPKRRPATVTDARAFQFAGDDFPMFATVRSYLRYQQQFQRDRIGNAAPAAVDDGALDAETRRFATDVLGTARRAAQHAWALKHLADRFPAALVDRESEDTREAWRSVVREHARAYVQATTVLRRDLEPVARMVDAEAAQLPSDTTPAASTGSTWTRVEHLLDAHRRQEAAIQHAFAIQADANGEVDAVQSAAFWELVGLCETIAAEIARNPLGR